MARKLDWEKAAMAGKRKLSLRDEQESLDRGFTKRWLEQAEKRGRSSKPAQRQGRKSKPAMGYRGRWNKDQGAGARRIHKQKSRP
jgi:hypothetical protein